MPWSNDRAAREHTAKTYGPEYRRNRELALTRDDHRCQVCGSNRDISVDHNIPVSAGGTHAVENLKTLCGEHHRQKTATEGGGYRKRGASDPEPAPRTTW